MDTRQRVKTFPRRKTESLAANGATGRTRQIPVHLEGGCMTGADEIAELRQQVAALTDQLRQAQKLTALGELVGTVTHEFNNVLTTIINYAKLGLRHRDQPTRDKAFDKIFAAGNRAAKITGTVLSFARNRSTSLEPTDLTRVIDDTLVLVDREMNKYRIAVDRQIQPAPPAIANANQIQQVLVNLLINARQAMPGGGHVVVRLAHDAASDMVELTVRDTGSGIPADKLPHIFEPFYTTKTGPDASGKGGTGLGLSLCRDIVEAHQGRIRVESTVGRGTAFTLKLPVAKAPAHAPVASTVTPVDQAVGHA
jgi:signal transduction histidine kinase